MGLCAAGYKQSNVCVSQKEFLEQRKSGKADGNKAVIAQCKEDTKIREVSLVHKDFEDRQDEKDKILEYYRKLCLGKEVCSVEPCTTRQCPAPGCHFDAKAPYKKRSIKYKCEGSPLKAKVCLSSKDAEQAKKERRLTKEGDIVVTKCAENEQVVEVMPDMPDDVNHENDEFSKQRQALETFCRRNEAHKFFVRCAFPVCGKDGECPTRDAFGCEFVPDEDRPGSPGSVTGDAHISYKCAPRKS